MLLHRSWVGPYRPDQDPIQPRRRGPPDRYRLPISGGSLPAGEVGNRYRSTGPVGHASVTPAGDAPCVADRRGVSTMHSRRRVLGTAFAAAAMFASGSTRAFADPPRTGVPVPETMAATGRPAGGVQSAGFRWATSAWSGPVRPPVARSGSAPGPGGARGRPSEAMRPTPDAAPRWCPPAARSSTSWTSRPVPPTYGSSRSTRPTVRRRARRSRPTHMPGSAPAIAAGPPGARTSRSGSDPTARSCSPPRSASSDPTARSPDPDPTTPARPPSRPGRHLGRGQADPARSGTEPAISRRSGPRRERRAVPRRGRRTGTGHGRSPLAGR